MPADATRDEDVAQGCAMAADRFGQLDVVVHAVGIVEAPGDAVGLPLATWSECCREPHVRVPARQARRPVPTRGGRRRDRERRVGVWARQPGGCDGLFRDEGGDAVAHAKPRDRPGPRRNRANAVCRGRSRRRSWRTQRASRRRSKEAPWRRFAGVGRPSIRAGASRRPRTSPTQCCTSPRPGRGRLRRGTRRGWRADRASAGAERGDLSMRPGALGHRRRARPHRRRRDRDGPAGAIAERDRARVLTAGAAVVIADLDEAKADALACELGEGRALACGCDVTRPGDVDRLLELAVTASGDSTYSSTRPAGSTRTA